MKETNLPEETNSKEIHSKEIQSEGVEKIFPIEGENQSVRETQKRDKPFVPHLQIEKTRSRICPVGIDWVSLYSVLHRDCVPASLLESAFYRKKSDGSLFRWHLKHQSDKQKDFFIFLTQRFHTRMVNGKREDSLEWYLNASFNPSHWMRDLGFGTRYKKYQRNHVAGNSLALRAALDELDGLIGGFGFFGLNGEVLCASGMIPQRNDVTRDTHFSLRYKDLHSSQQEDPKAIINQRIDTAVVECLEIFQSIAPPYSRVASARHCYNGREYYMDDMDSISQKSFKDYEEFEEYEESQKAHGDTIKTIRGTGEWRLNIYNKYLVGPKGSKIAEPSGQLRCEYQLLTAKKIRDTLGISTAGELVARLDEVSDWHEQGCVGQMPVLEAAVETVLDKMLSDPPAVKRAKNLPDATNNLVQLYHRLWYRADGAGDTDLPEIKVGKMLTEDEARYINNGVIMKQFSEIYQAAAEVVGYVSKRQQLENARRISEEKKGLERLAPYLSKVVSEVVQSQNTSDLECKKAASSCLKHDRNVDEQNVHKQPKDEQKDKQNDILDNRAIMENPVLARLALEDRDAKEAAEKKAAAKEKRDFNTNYTAFKRLVMTLKIIRKFSETSSARNWTEQRDIVRTKVLLKP